MPSSITIPEFLGCEPIHDVAHPTTPFKGDHNVQFYVLYAVLKHIPFLSFFVWSLLVEFFF